MTLKALRCPHCGGIVQFDEQMKKGYCMYCGNPVVNEPDTPAQVTVDHSDLVANELTLAQLALESGAYPEAVAHAKKALEYDRTAPQGWTVQAEALLKDEVFRGYATADSILLSGWTRDGLPVKERGMELSDEEFRQDTLRIMDNGKYRAYFDRFVVLCNHGLTAAVPREDFEAPLTALLCWLLDEYLGCLSG